MGQQQPLLRKEPPQVTPLFDTPNEFSICPHNGVGGRKFCLYIIGLKKSDPTINAIKQAIREISPLFGSEKFYPEEPYICRFKMPKCLGGDFTTSLVSKLIWTRMLQNIMISGWRPKFSCCWQRMMSKASFVFERMGEYESFEFRFLGLRTQKKLFKCLLIRSFNEKVFITHKHTTE